ncbi:MAG: T9SS type A sorting domain-containing protein [FCB group bacterium]
MLKKITFLFLSMAMLMTMLFSNAYSQTGVYTFGCATTPYYYWTGYAWGWMTNIPSNCAMTVISVQPMDASSYTTATGVTFQLARLSGYGGSPMENNSTAPQQTLYSNGVEGVYTNTDLRVQGGNYLALIYYYQSTIWGSNVSITCYNNSFSGTLYDLNGNGYGVNIYAAYWYSTLPASYIYDEGNYYYQGSYIKYATPRLLTTQVVTGTGTIVQSGSQTPALPAGQVWYNASTSFLVTAGSGLYITDIVINDATHYGFQTSPYTLALNNIQTNWNIKVYFGYNVQLVTGGTTIAAYGYPAGFQYFPAGAIVQFNVAPQYAGAKITLLTICDRDNPSTSFSIPITNGGTGQSIMLGNSSTGLPAPFNTPLSLNVKITAQANIPIDASSGPHGQITNAGVLLYTYNSNTFIVMTPDPNYKFDQILIDGVNKLDVNGNPTDANLKIKTTAPMSATYTFNNIISPRSIHVEYYAHQIKYVIGGTGLGGSLNPATPNPLRVNDNITAYYQDVPLPDFKISYLSWTDGTTTWLPSGAYPAHGAFNFELDNVVNDMTISTSFTIATYTVTIKRHEGGQIVPYGTLDPVTGIGTMIVNSGVTKVFTISHDAGSHLVDVLVDGVSQGPITTYTMTTIRANRTIEAIFAKDAYHVYGVPGPNGTIFPKDTTVNSGGDIDVVVTPDIGYKISSEQLNGITKNPETEFQILNIKTSQTVTAVFEPTAIWTITTTTNTGGTITPNGVVNVNDGLNKTFTITPNKGYMVKDVLVDGASVGPVTAYTFKYVTANHTIDVTFEMIPVPVVQCTLNTTPVVSGIPFSMTVKLIDSTTGNPYPVPVDVPVTIKTTGIGVLSGVTTGTMLKSTADVTIDGIIYTNDNGEINVQFSAGAFGYKACSTITTVMAKEPATQESQIVFDFSKFTTTGVSLAWTKGDGANRIGLMKPKSAILTTELPADGTNYTANSAFSSGQAMGSDGCYVIYNDKDNNVNITGLSLGETYYVMFCGYNGVGPTSNYNLNTATNNPNSALIVGVNDNKPVSLSGFDISNVAPNPVVNDLHFTLTTAKTMPITIELLDMSGRKVVTNSKTFDPGSFDINIPVNQLSAGVYVVKVSSGNDFAFTTITIVR